MESLALAFEPLYPMYNKSDYLFNKFKEYLKEVNPNFEEEYSISDEYDDFQIDEEKISKYLKIKGSKIFEGIRYDAFSSLYSKGLFSHEDFLNVTKDEVLALKWIGPATINKLIKNGVKFKEN